MKNCKNLILLLIVGLLVLGLACSESDKIVSDDPSESDETVNDDPSVLTSYEIPSDLKDLLDFNELPEDGSHDGDLLSPEFDPPNIADTSYDVYSVTLIWGNHSNDHMSDITTMDWSGTLSVNGEAWVVPVKAIMFEPDEDRILDNPSPSEAAWESVTHGGYDGISFLVFLKRGIIYITEPRLSFNTEPLAQSWDFGHLRKINACYKTDAGAVLGIHAHQIQRYHCPKGLMAGRWIKNGDNPHSGRFEGLWMEANSDPAGWYNGRFWMSDDGVGRYEGSVSGYITDQVIAEFHGQWVYDDPTLCPTCGENRGKFKGRVKWLEHEISGEMWGGFGPPDSAYTYNHEKLPMAGFWRANCDSPDTSRLTD